MCISLSHGSPGLHWIKTGAGLDHEYVNFVIFFLYSFILSFLYSFIVFQFSYTIHITFSDGKIAIRSYIGASDKGSKKAWVWPSGSPLNYSNWGVHQPSNKYDGNCAMLETQPYNGNVKAGWWNDIKCDVEGDIGGFICSFNINGKIYYSNKFCSTFHVKS